ncbi:hypothetical protein NQ317_004967 [Molorchus minor]|uniref:proline--tRNA ligase n=1 Tax=Molorchus minor TaxID=1323400 RepID=A0ABQ9K252_9CUCU|nr:hypothetical protein NQ317_004967 [Molorchus minor]
MSVNSGRHCLSKIFQPVTIVSKTANLGRQDVTSKSQRLMLELGIIQQAVPGCFHFLPLGMKSLEKLIRIVDSEMLKIEGQKVMFPGLIDSKLWKTSGRLEDSSELFQLKDRHNHDYLLSPTHEEVASELISRLGHISYKHYPLRLYQITVKYRDELKPRFGLMRGREFLMKDMYSFDTDVHSARKTYEEVCQCYDSIFKKIGVGFLKVLGTSGTMGGNLSHEYHYLAHVGEDRILLCQNCNYLANVQLSGSCKCPKCGEQTKLDIKNSIEVGHTFFLGVKYSKSLKAHFLSKNAKPEVLQMGSYGMGLSRLIAASVEVLSTEQEMRWPDSLAPYNIVILPPKAGSKEEAKTKNIAEKLYVALEGQIEGLKDNVLLDDRLSLTLGRRFLDAKRVGYRYIVVINKRAADVVPLFEFNDIKTNTRLYLSENELLTYIKDNTVF